MDEQRRTGLLEGVDQAIQYHEGQGDSIKGTVLGKIILPALRFLFERLEQVDTGKDGHDGSRFTKSADRSRAGTRDAR